jgi:hypothetical protein
MPISLRRLASCSGVASVPRAKLAGSPGMTLKARKLKTDTRKRVTNAELILFTVNDNANSCQKYDIAEKTALYKYNGYTLMSQWQYPLVEQFD